MRVTSWNLFRSRRRETWGAGLALATLVGLGCGDRRPELVPVQGTVLLDGQPLKVGQVLTQPDAGRGANGAIQPDGTFQLQTGREPGALVGVHRVAVVAYEAGDSTLPEAPLGKLLVSQRYTSAETSGLTIEVKRGSDNSPTLELSSSEK